MGCWVVRGFGLRACSVRPLALRAYLVGRLALRAWVKGLKVKGGASGGPRLTRGTRGFASLVALTMRLALGLWCVFVPLARVVDRKRCHTGPGQ